MLVKNVADAQVSLTKRCSNPQADLEGPAFSGHKFTLGM